MENLPTTQTSSEVLKEIKELVDDVYAKKIKADKAEKDFKEAKNKLAEIMQNAEVDKIQGDDCTASLSFKSSVSCPKEDAKKLELFEYLASKDDSDKQAIEELVTQLSNHSTLLRMLTINARTFSSWYDKEVEQKAAEGDVEFKLPMVSSYDYYSVGLRKRSGK